MIAHQVPPRLIQEVLPIQEATFLVVEVILVEVVRLEILEVHHLIHLGGRPEISMTLRDLSTLYNSRTDKQYPHVPVYAKTQKKFTDNSTNELRDAILAYFELRGIKAWPVATEGRYIAEKWQANVIGQKVQTQKGMYIPRSKKAVGVADIAAVLPPGGRYLAVEQKRGTDRQREGQKEFQADIERCGGLYIIVKTWEDFDWQISKIVG